MDGFTAPHQSEGLAERSEGFSPLFALVERELKFSLQTKPYFSWVMAVTFVGWVEERNPTPTIVSLLGFACALPNLRTAIWAIAENGTLSKFCK